MLLFDGVKKSHYETLGVAKNAMDPEIKRAYFGLVRKFQPDRFPQEFKEIRAAYEILSDREKRAEYDAIGDLPAAVAPLFHEAQRLDRFGRRDKAAELYRMILKMHPELDNVREQYARSLSADDKIGKAGKVWEELCGRHPDNPHYARELGECYLEHGWHKKAHAEVRRSLALDRTSMDSWALLITCTIAGMRTNPNYWEDLQAVSFEAVESVKVVKTDEWKKILLYTHAFIACGSEKIDIARGHLQEILRLVREGGRKGQEEGQHALEEILRFIPSDVLASFYPALKELAALLPGMGTTGALIQLDEVRLSFEIEGLVNKGFHEMFRDLFRLLIADLVDDEDEFEILTIECILLQKRDSFASQLRRLRKEFPELYGLHSAFFNEALRTRDPDKLLFQRAKKFQKLKRQYGFHDEDPESAPEQPVRRDQPKVGRNDPCPCGSGKKYKRCCGT